ncbi:MAG: glycoside hydrolase family 2 protein, partial [Candidatus Acidiferrales bacterium]
YEDLTMLAHLPRVKLEGTASREAAASGPEVSVQLRNPTAHLAFQVRLAVTEKGSNEILPIFWSDNYFELLPGETKTLTARYPAGTKLAEGVKLEVGGWNIEPVMLAVLPSHIEAAKPAKVTR